MQGQVGTAPVEIPTEAPEACCAVVRCGTSRIVVFDGRDLPDPPAREAELAELMLGGGQQADGLGGDHYQLNKVAVVWPDPPGFRFRFYQVDRSARSLVGDLECANAAAGAAVFALLRGQASLDETGVVEASNDGTGQRVVLRPHHRNFWDCAWDVRFLLEERTPRRFSGGAPLALVSSSGEQVALWVIEQGNVFVLADVSRAHLEEAGGAIALQLGSDPHRAAGPKVVTYDVRSVEAETVQAAVACFYRGERHASLPGSAAMCLASFLAGWRLDQLPATAERGMFVFDLHHPAGTLPVRVHWLRHAGFDWICATEFTTSVRLLLRGSALRPAEVRP
jgi:2-methylaconitate cis-trans-isomerase PrpF